VCDTGHYIKVKEFIKSEIKNIELIIQDEKTEIATFFSKSDGTIMCLDENGHQSTLKYLGAETNGIMEKLRDKTLSKNDRKIFWQIQKEMRRAKKSKNNFSKRKIYRRFLHNEKQSFKSYGKKSAEILESDILRKQFSDINIVRIIRKKIKKINQIFFNK